MSNTAAVQQGSWPAGPGQLPQITGKLRLWVPIVLLAAYWTYLLATPAISMGGGMRFVSRMLLGLVVILGFLGWWLSRRGIPLRDRLGAIGVVILLGMAALFAADKSIEAFGLVLSAFPIVLTAWTAWSIVGRSLSPTALRLGFVAIMLLVFGYFTLVRFDGLDAVQQSEMSWRWQPTHEQIFLTTQNGSTTAIPAADENAASAPAKPWALQPGDCPEYRGVNRDGVITSAQLLNDWTAHPPKLLWREKVGPGWSGVIVVDGHLVTQEQRGDKEVVVCHDAATGKEIWVHADDIRFEEGLSGAGPRSTPTFSGGRIYTMGARGLVNCLVAETGEVVWSHDAAVDAGLTPLELPQWGYSVSPLVVDGLVVVFAGGTQDKSLVAYRADNGELAWTCPGGAQSYSSPQAMTIQGVKQIVMHDSRALMGINIADGKLLWENLGPGGMSLPMLQPHLSEAGGVLTSAEPATSLVEVMHEGDKWVVEPRWSVSKFRPGFNDFVIHDGNIYGLDDGILCCLDLASGERLWKKGRYGHGQILLLPEQNELLLSSDKGEMILVSVSPEGQQELGRFQAIEGKTWNSPVLVDNRIFLRNGEEMAAYELPTDVTAAGAPASK